MCVMAIVNRMEIVNRVCSVFSPLEYASISKFYRSNGPLSIFFFWDN